MEKFHALFSFLIASISGYHHSLYNSHECRLSVSSIYSLLAHAVHDDVRDPIHSFLLQYLPSLKISTSSSSEASYFSERETIEECQGRD